MPLARITKGGTVTLAQMDALAAAANDSPRIASTLKPFAFAPPYFLKNSAEAMLATHEASWGDMPGGIVIRTDTKTAYQLANPSYTQPVAWAMRNDIHVIKDGLTVLPAAPNGDWLFILDAVTDTINYVSPWMRRINGAWKAHSWKIELNRIRAAAGPLSTAKYLYTDQYSSHSGHTGLSSECAEARYVTTDAADAVTMRCYSTDLGGYIYQYHPSRPSDDPAWNVARLKLRCQQDGVKVYNLTGATLTWSVSFSAKNLPVGTELAALSITGTGAALLGTMQVSARTLASDSVVYYGVTPDGTELDEVDLTFAMPGTSADYRGPAGVRWYGYYYQVESTDFAPEEHIHNTLATLACRSIPSGADARMVQAYGVTRDSGYTALDWYDISGWGSAFNRVAAWNIGSLLRKGFWLWKAAAVLDMAFDEQRVVDAYTVSKLAPAAKYPNTGQPLLTLQPEVAAVAPSHELSQSVEGGVPSLWAYDESEEVNTKQTGIVPGAMVYEVTVKRLLVDMGNELAQQAQWGEIPVKVGHIRNGEFVVNFEVVIPAGQEAAPVTYPNLINFTGTALTYQAQDPVVVTAMIASVNCGYSVGVPGALPLGTQPMLACHYNDTVNLLNAL